MSPEMLPSDTVVPIGSTMICPPDVVHVAGSTKAICAHVVCDVMGGNGLGSGGVANVNGCGSETMLLPSTVAWPPSVSAVTFPLAQSPTPVLGVDSDP